MSVFGEYARYYDLLYRDKDYAGEAARVARLLRGAAAPVRRVIELGCGTGGHAVALARMGYAVTATDVSEAMLAGAQARYAGLDEVLRARLGFRHMDARTGRLGEPFDAVVALFHVLSYQTTNADFAAILATAAAHLLPGSLFVFDFWYGPAVLWQRPDVRVRRLEDGELELARIAEPSLRENDNCVDVRYTLWIRDRRSAKIESVTETHAMRYFFLPELEAALAQASLQLMSSQDMTTGEPLGVGSWSACATARKL